MVFSLPKIADTQRKCEVEIIFLDKQGQPEDNFCGKRHKLEEDIESSNTHFIANIALKKVLDTWYILEEDIRLVSKSKKIVAIPIHENVYSLTDKNNYDENYANVYYSLYARLYWKLKSKSSNLPYENFKRIPERDMIDDLFDLVSSRNE